ncbi:LpqB family beta-propeller domain-containing protein [Kitasatospora sp. NBC_01250]|uniref:hypothetical protein n=1 Tax=unclassified Kitasatospora TaxID=2633591 RepID=UPI002E10B094|nr:MULTISPECIES: hypothetical protein [unclassified Kitasatospora]WSJ68823.1 LpqB family beta-propeller domain-containing protein [Kitasatospora sp. NBC_01302]
MVARHRRRPATTVALAAALSAGAVMLLSACGPDEVAATSPAQSASAPAAQPAGSSHPGTAAPTAKGKSPGASSSTPADPSGTVHSPLTVSNGTPLVMMNGTSVDFHTPVRDLSWSPDGSKAAFVNGDGSLVVANPDGSGQVTVARNPGGQTWSHPTWQVNAAGDANGVAAKNNVIFTVDQGGTTHLASVPATAAGAAPAKLDLSPGIDDPAVPQSANAWANTAGPHGITTAYENTADGKIYLRDDYTREQTRALTAGSEPALAPDASTVVFVRSSGGHDHLFEMPLGQQNATAKDLTPNATTDYTEPALSPDGKLIAARTPTGIVTLPTDGSAAPTMTVNAIGLPAFRA